ncbi:MAG: Fur family transcriptional regulator [Actinomycetota bacterium]
MQQVDSAIEQRLTSAGIRYTNGRRALVATLFGMDGPRSAAEIHADLAGSIPLSSLYRSLTVLTEAGILATHHGPTGVMSFELAEWITGHHHHLVCVSCDAVIDATPDKAQERAMGRLVVAMASAYGFEASDHRFEIEGTCASCR